MSYTEVNFNPNEEDAESQNKLLLAYLQAGNSITSLESWLLIECGHLASRIDELKNHKMHPIETVDVIREQVVDPDTGKVLKKKKRFCAYFIAEGIKKRYSVKDEDVPELVKAITERRINGR